MVCMYNPQKYDGYQERRAYHGFNDNDEALLEGGKVVGGKFGVTGVETPEPSSGRNRKRL